MAEKPPNIWMPLFIGDYIADTTHLTCEQHGAYLLLLMTLWRRRGRLPDDDGQLGMITGLHPEKWALHRPILKEFFTIEGGYWTHGRATREIENAEIRAQTARENGKNGGRPKNPEKTNLVISGYPSNNPDHNPEKSSSPSPSPSSSTLPPKNINSVADATDSLKLEFEKARKLYPGSKRGLETEFQNFKKKHRDHAAVVPLIIPAIELGIRFRKFKEKNGASFIEQWKNFQTWINGRHWEDEFPREVYL